LGGLIIGAFTDLLRAVRRIFSRPAKINRKPILVIPYLAAIRDARQADTVAAQCRECSRLLASHLYVWRRTFPQKSTVKTWNAGDQCFSGMDLDLFISYLTARYRFHTEDSREWILDRAITALIWDACTGENSVLPPASWQVETDLKRRAVR
jgi:hypothetical protein